MVVDHGSIPSAYYVPLGGSGSSESGSSIGGGGEGEDGVEGVYVGDGSKGGLSVVFAGTRLKADDVLVRDVTFFDRDVVVVTADNELMSRCKSAVWNVNNNNNSGGNDSGRGRGRGSGNNDGKEEGKGTEIVFVHPITFICDLEAAMAEEMEIERQMQSLEDINSDGDTTTTTVDSFDNTINEKLFDTIDEEIKIRGNMYDTEIRMRQKKNMNTPKKRRKLEKQARMLCERLAMKGGQNIDHLTSVTVNRGNGDGSSITKYDRKFQDEVLKQWEELRRTATRKEMTGDRMMLAEYFRRQIEKEVITGEIDQTNVGLDVNVDVVDDTNTPMKRDVKDYVHHLNNMMGKKGVTALSPSAISSTTTNNTPYRQASTSSNDDTNKPLRLVIISDTHGYEELLTPNDTTLPPGDILLHLGDFAVDGSIKKKNKAIAKFDEWLSRQPHPTKIVIRGNHDPFKVNFPLSNANFYSKPNSIAIDDGRLAMALVPYCSPRALSSSWRKMPIFSDVLASHSPPFNVLDKCYNGRNAGCATLRGKVEKMIAGPPRLWVCGHIHEGRGSVRTTFGFSARETLVINAANANCGRARGIEHGPVVVDIDENNEIVVVDQEEKKEKVGGIEEEEEETAVI